VYKTAIVVCIISHFFCFLLVPCSAGGFVTAVAPFVIQAKGIWVGWPGLLDDVNEPIPQSDLSDKTLTAGLFSENVRYLNWPNDTFVSVCVYAVARPVFRYFMPLGPRNFCVPPPPYLFVFTYVQLSFQVQLISSTIPAIPLGTNIVFSIDLP